jgi:transcriptional regulator of acetoin/glycerol metabolism
MQAVVLSKGDVLETESILLSKKNVLRKSKSDEAKMSLADVEKRQIIIVLDKVNWNKQKACQILGITKPTLYQKLNKYNISKPELN